MGVQRDKKTFALLYILFFCIHKIKFAYEV